MAVLDFDGRIWCRVNAHAIYYDFCREGEGGKKIGKIDEIFRHAATKKSTQTFLWIDRVGLTFPCFVGGPLTAYGDLCCDFWT
jgi:hypothetical protein